MVITGALNPQLLIVKLRAIKSLCRPDKKSTIAFGRCLALIFFFAPSRPFALTNALFLITVSLQCKPLPLAPLQFTPFTLLFVFLSSSPSLIPPFFPFFSSLSFNFALLRSVEPSWRSVKCIICDLMSRWASRLLSLCTQRA